MALSYTKTPVIVGACLQILRKIEARIDQAIKADNANYDRRLLVQSNGLDTSVDVDAVMLGKQLAFFDGDLQSALRSQWNAYRALLESDDNLFGFIAAGLSPSDKDRRAGAIEYEYDTTNGVVSIVNRLGFLGALYNDMVTNGQKVVANAVTVGSLTAKSGNRGTLSASSKTALSHLLAGKLVFEVTDELVDAPKLSVVHELTLPTYDEETQIKADNNLQVDASFEDGPTGLSALFVRSGLASPTITGDAGSPMFSSVVIDDPKEADMSGGVLQVKVTRMPAGTSGGIWLVEFYRASDRATKVGRFMTDTTSGTYAFDVTLTNGTQVAGNFSRANAHTALPSDGDTDNDISIDIKTPRLGDRWTCDVTNDYAGSFATRIAQAWRISLPVSGSTLWTDAKAAAVSMS